MKALKAAAAELFGLFVDDGALALSVLIWLGVCAMLLPTLDVPPAVPPAILFAGLAVILASSAIRRAGSR